MTLEEAGKRFLFAPERLEQYIAYGFLRKEGTRKGAENYRDEDFEQLALIGTLMEAECPPEDIKGYLCLTEKQGTLKQQIRMLQRQRRIVLDDIHKRHQVLDRLDFMIWEKKKLCEEESK